MLSLKQLRTKRFIDLLISLLGIVISIIPLIVLVLLSSISTRSFGLFFQERVGKHARIFILYKIKTMLIEKNGDKKVRWFGRILRRSKLDELPQLFNVLIGDMSIVGPRPDVIGYADNLKGDDRIILSVKPGITGPATLLYFDEEEILNKQENPLFYNNTVLWPRKVELNRKYVEGWSLKKDFKYIFKTLRRFLRIKGKIKF